MLEKGARLYGAKQVLGTLQSHLARGPQKGLKESKGPGQAAIEKRQERDLRHMQAKTCDQIELFI